MGDGLGLHGGGVVAAGLGKAGAAPDGADVLFLHVDGHGLQAVGVVGAGGGEEHAVDVVVGLLDAQLGLVADDEGTDVEGGFLVLGDPVLIEHHKLLQGLDAEVNVQSRDAQALVGTVQTLEVLLGPEEQDAAVLGAVGLHALEGLLGVVEDGGGGAQGDGTVGNDAGVMPADAPVVVHEQHVVGEDGAEAQLRALGGLFLGVRGFGDGNVHDDISFTMMSEGRCGHRPLRVESD